MQRLILVRHADAQPRAPGQRDIDRPLSPRGERDAAVMGRALAAAGVSPDLVLVSTAVRTRQTWAAAQAAFPAAQARFEAALYNAPAGDIARLADGETGETIMLVAHNPGIALYAAHLAERAGAPAAAEAIGLGFPPATAAVFTREGTTIAFERLLRADDLGSEA